MLKKIAPVALVLLLTGCGGLTYYAHDEVPSLRGKALSAVTVEAGQTIKLLKHSTGLMWGGFKEGVVVEDSTIVEVRYGKDGSDNWAPTVYLIGLKPGTTRAVYCNRLGERPDFSQALDDGFQKHSFEVIVR